MACHTLGQVGSRCAVDRLVDALNDEADVRDAAGLALRRITGRDLPPEPDAWRAAMAR